MRQLNSRLSKLEGNVGHVPEVPPIWRTDNDTGEVISAWVIGTGEMIRNEHEERQIFERRVARAYASRRGLEQMTDAELEEAMEVLKAYVAELRGEADS